MGGHKEVDMENAAVDAENLAADLDNAGVDAFNAAVDDHNRRIDDFALSHIGEDGHTLRDFYGSRDDRYLWSGISRVLGAIGVATTAAVATVDVFVNIPFFDLEDYVVGTIMSGVVYAIGHMQHISRLAEIQTVESRRQANALERIANAAEANPSSNPVVHTSQPSTPVYGDSGKVPSL